MIYETVTALLEKTGLTINDVEMVMGAGDDVLCRRRALSGLSRFPLMEEWCQAATTLAIEQQKF